MVKIILVTGDCHIFKTHLEIMLCSPLVKHVTKLPKFRLGGIHYMRLQFIDGSTMGRILRWADYHLHDMPNWSLDDLKRDSEKDAYMDKYVDFDIDLLDVNIEELDKLSKAADFLQIKTLSVVCHKIGKRLNGKTTEATS